MSDIYPHPLLAWEIGLREQGVETFPVVRKKRKEPAAVTALQPTQPAVHEAAHVAAAHAFGIHPVSVQVRPEPLVDFGPGIDKQPAGDVARIRLAGPLADQKAFGTKAALDSVREMAEVGAVLQVLAEARGVAVEGVLDEARSQVLRILNSRWTAILRLARRLDQVGALTGDEAFAVLMEGA